MGCGGGGNVAPDGGPDTGGDAGQAEDGRTLELLGEETRQLGFGETSTLELVYLEDGNVPGDAVSFAIEGNAGDSSLSAVTAVPDPEGHVVTTLRAGTVGAASFRVRASAPGAANAYVEVSVGDAGFGSLSVVADYRGSREVWGCELRLYTAQACGELDPRASPVADRSVHVGGSMDDGRWTAVFPSLAVGPSYTVLAMGLGEGGGIVASGCMPGVAVVADPAAPVEVTVTLDDQPYGASGRFAVSSNLDLADAMSGRVDAWLAPSTALLGGGAEAFVLDEVALYLAQNMPDEVDGSFEQLRPELARELAERFASRDADPSVALASLAADLDASLTSPTLRSELLLDQVVQAEDQASALRFSHEARALDVSLVVGGVAIGSRSVPFADAGLVSLSSGAATTTTEQLALGAHTLPFRLGTLAASVLEGVLLEELGATSLDDYFTQTLDCAELGGWLAEQGESPCDGACYEAACLQAAAHLAASVDQGLRAGDADYDSLGLEGTAHLADADGDATTDALDGGVWSAHLSGALESDVIADFSGERDDIE